MAMKVLLVLVLIVVSAFVLGCNTVQGVGRDIEWVGEKAAEMVH